MKNQTMELVNEGYRTVRRHKQDMEEEPGKEAGRETESDRNISARRQRLQARLSVWDSGSHFADSVVRRGSGASGQTEGATAYV